ncbi:MAG: hypothetical protein ACYCSN_09485 [Acidobacteriaceae bacterium]
MNGVEQDRTSDYVHSSLRERIVEHLFVGEALRWLWVHRKADLADVEVLRSEFDAGGYDLVMTYKKIVRHIQFKTTKVETQKADISASLKLMDKPSGCIIWIFITPELELYEYRWFGNPPGQMFPDIKALKPAKHTKGNAQGNKAERPQHRIIPKAKFSKRCTLDDIMNHLFGQLS